jgi:hypothetical protein
MEEFVEITAKYQPAYIEHCFSSMAGLHEELSLDEVERIRV